MDVFGSIRGLLKVDSVTVDNNIFRLHYKVTMLLLVACSALMTQKQYFGDPIDCIVTGVPQPIMDTFCWIHSTYTVPALSGELGNLHPYQGIGNRHKAGNEYHEVKYNKYYQWVTLVLYLQALMFYVPRYVWKQWEGGRLKMLVQHLDSPIVDDEAKNARIDMLTNYFSSNIHTFDFYAFRFFLCEVLNFVNVISQIFFTDRFLGYTFTTYGVNVLGFSGREVGSHMDSVFPKLTKCDMYTYGSSGTLQKHDGLCVLPLNIFNEKIYIFLWFWFLIVAVVSGLGLLYRLATFMPAFRQILLSSRSRLAASEKVHSIVAQCGMGDWFLLYQLAKSMDPLAYRQFIGQLADKLAHRSSPS